MIKEGRAGTAERYENKNKFRSLRIRFLTEAKEGSTFKTLSHFLT